MEMTKFSKKEELRNNIKDFFVSLGEWIKFFAKTIFRNKKAFIGSLILLIFIFIAIFCRLIFP